MIRALPPPEEELDVVMEELLILFDGEVVVGSPTDQMGCQSALAQERIGSDVLAPDVHLLDKRDESSYLISALETILAGKQSDFFWV